jgi:hypothetical protein
MNIQKYALGVCALALMITASPLHAQEPEQVLEESVALVETFTTPLEEAVSTVNKVIGRFLEGDLSRLPADVTSLRAYVDSVPEEKKQLFAPELATMEALAANDPTVAVTPVAFLLATNELYKHLNDFLYETAEQETPAYMYQLKHLARKLQYQTLEGNWKEIEENTSEDIVDLVSDIYRNLEDPTVWQNTIRPVNEALLDGVDAQDVTAVYGAGQAYLNAAPIIETATMKKVEEEKVQQAAEEKKKNTLMFVLIGGFVLLIGAFIIIRRRKA